MVIADEKLYAATAGSEGGGLRIFDISRPHDLVQIDSYNSDCQYTLDLALSDDGKTVYLGCGNGLQVLDVSNPEQPKLLGKSPKSKAQVDSIAVSDNHLYISEGTTLKVLNVQNLQKLVLLMSYQLPFPSSRLRVLDDKLYAFIGDGGMAVFTITR